MSDIEDAYTELNKIIVDLENKFINPYLPTDPNIPPAAYSLDVKAYCVLSHAALEEYFERIARKVLENFVVAIYDRRRKIDRGILMLIRSHADTIKFADETKETIHYLRELSETVNKRFSNYIHNNHGISAKEYLANLMLPLGIDIPRDPILLNSLDQLAKERGEYAHLGTVQKILSPEDAKAYVHDCLILSEKIKKQAKTKIPKR